MFLCFSGIKLFMAYNVKLADMIRELISLTHKKVEEKAMFGGLCFMVNDKMCVVVHDNEIMLRINPDDMEAAVKKDGCAPMLMNGKKMEGYVVVQETGYKTKKELNYWVQMALTFNHLAKSSKLARLKGGKKTVHKKK